MTATGGMEILSDTGGVDFGPYIKRLHVTVEDRWYPLVPLEALPPVMKSGTVTIEFAILKNGDLRDMKLTQSSGDAALDRAAWGAIITSRPLPELPGQFSRDFLRLRCKFIYNPDKETTPAVAERSRQVYNQGLAEIKGENWGNAERLMQQAVELEPNFASAWNDLGRAHMHLNKYSEAEAAFGKFLALKPDDPLPYVQLAWALSSEQKYLEAVDLLEKRVATAPSDGEAYSRLGFAYLRLFRPVPAMKAFEKALQLLPNSEFVNYQLGVAYLQTGQNDDAAAAFERSLAIKRSESKLNDSAYQLSKFKTHLDLAETWANSAVNEIEAELNQVTLQTTQTNTATLLRRAAMYWDTMGWIKFQRQDLSTAERYLRAGWELADDTTIGFHLGRLYETQGRKTEAIEVYAETLAVFPANRDLTDDEKETRRRLAALLGGEAGIDARVSQSRPTLKDRRSVGISNAVGAQGMTEYQVMVGPGAKLTDLQAINGDTQFDKLSEAIRAAAMPQTLPDSGILHLPRAGILTCAGPDRPCSFTLFPAESSARSFSAAPTAGNER